MRSRILESAGARPQAPGNPAKPRTRFITCLGTYFSLLQLALAQSWQDWRSATLPPLPWRAVAASADFTKLIAAGGIDSADFNAIPPVFYQLPLPVYRSTDWGLFWGPTGSPAKYWVAVASSADGSHLAAAADVIYTSHDSGVTWGLTGAPTNRWTAVASSADVTRLVAVGGGLIYTSRDSGTNWRAASAPARNWVSLASSADGATLLVAAWDWPPEQIRPTSSTFVSLDAGTKWFQAFPTATNGCAGVACSADGKTLYALSTNCRLVVSTNSGASWTLTSDAVGGPLACSADGLMVSASHTTISTNGGRTWTDLSAPAGVPPCENEIVVLAADGQRLLTAIADDETQVAEFPCSGEFWVWSASGSSAVPPRLTIHSLATGLHLSWTVPSTSYQLEQSPDLSPNNWTPVGATPALNLNNLHNEVTLPQPRARLFYRLRRQ